MVPVRQQSSRRMEIEVVVNNAAVSAQASLICGSNSCWPSYVGLLACSRHSDRRGRFEPGTPC